MRLTGFAAIEFAEKQGMRLSKFPDAINDARVGLTVAEAEAIADENEDLIYLDVDDELYYGSPNSYEPSR